MSRAFAKAKARATRCAEGLDTARRDADFALDALRRALEAPRFSLRRVAFLAWDVHMAAGDLWSHATWTAEARREVAQAKRTGRVRRLVGPGWPHPQDVRNARQRRRQPRSSRA